MHRLLTDLILGSLCALVAAEPIPGKFSFVQWWSAWKLLHSAVVLRRLRRNRISEEKQQWREAEASSGLSAAAISDERLLTLS